MFRDMNIPYTEAEFVEMKKKWTLKPSYRVEDESIGTEDFSSFMLNDMRMERTKEELEAHKDYFNKNFNGRGTWEIFIKLADNYTQPNKSGYYAVYVKECDKDNNGFISASEFGKILDYMTKFDKKYADLSFDDFTAQADTNKDGKVSVDECIAWIQKVTA